MPSYVVLEMWNVSKTSLRVDVLIDVETREAAITALNQASQELIGSNDTITIYGYIEAVARKWEGWIGRVEYEKESTPAVYFDNDPVLREAIYNDLKERKS